MATSSTMNADLVDQFVAVTGAARSVAINLLEACAGNLDMAVGMHMDGSGAGPSDAAQGEGGSLSSFNEDSSEDGVRAPIPQKTEVLVEEDASKIGWRMRRPRRHASSVFDGFRNFQAEANQYEETLRGKRPSKKRNLEDLFRPPVDITYKGTFQNARDAGSAQNKWLLVNVQNVQEFPCQLLNRDVWSNTEARSIIKDSFVFWQVYNDSEEGKRFMQFYKLTQWPYVAIIDPFTGENQIVWNKISDGIVFCDLAKDFLASCPVPDNSQLPPAAKRQRREPSIVDASEQEQMEAAIQASLVENKTKPSSPQYVLDSDSEADLVEDSDDVETFSDSDDVIVASSPGSSNGVTGNKASQSSTSSSTQPSSNKVISPLKNERSKRQQRNNLPSPNQPSTSSFLSQSSSLQASTSSSTSSLSSSQRRHNLSRFSPSTSSEVRIVHQDEDNAGPSGTASVLGNIWAASSQSGRDSPLDVNIETTSLIDMIGCREAEVSTPPVVCTLDDSPSDSQLSALDGDSQDERLLSQGSSQQSSQGNTQTSSGWKDYWGSSKDPVSKIMIRYPDNKREQIELPCSSQVKALIELCSSKGYSPDKYELVTNFPRRKLSQMDSSTTLKDAGLYPQDTVFVQDV